MVYRLDMLLLRDALLAWTHFATIFVLIGALAGELVLYRRALSAVLLRTLARVDALYGIAAGAVIASGLARVFFSLKGPAYYAHNPVFWTKMGLFVAVALLSIAPTIHYRRLLASAQNEVVIDAPGYARTRALLIAQTVLVFAIPLCAAIMARGL